MLTVATALSAQTVQTRILPNYTTPFSDNNTQRVPPVGSEAKGDLLAAQWLLYPNPVHGDNFALNLDLRYATELEARIVNSGGRVMAAERFSELPEGLTTLGFELADFPTGMYYLHLQNRYGMLTIPFAVGQ
jgi:hypothetical protein